MATSDEIVEQLQGVRDEMADLRKNEQWRQEIAEEQHATTKTSRAALRLIALVLVGLGLLWWLYLGPTLHVLESAVNPDGKVYKKGQQQSAQIVKALLDNGTTQGRTQAERVCRL